MFEVMLLILMILIFINSFEFIFRIVELILVDLFLGIIICLIFVVFVVFMIVFKLCGSCIWFKINIFLGLFFLIIFIS